MTNHEPSIPNRAQQVWSHFSGLFGADRLKRKFGPSPPREWESALSYLTEAQLRHGFDTTLKSGASDVPSLPEFLLNCRQAREWTDVDEFGEVKKLPTPTFDKWAIEANSHLYGYIWERAGGFQWRHRTHVHYYTASETMVLVQFKNSWAEDMRVEDQGEGVPLAKQNEAWRDCMARAELALMPAEARVP